MENYFISNNSTKEEVAEFFKNTFKVSEDVSNNFIKEYISGDILPILSDQDLKSLGLKLGPIKRWKKYYNENIDKFKEEEILEEISLDSSSEEVKKFLESCLDFKENYNLNGEILFELCEEDMKRLGMKLGQRKKLIKYINQMNMNKNIIISKNSSEEEVSDFLMKELKLSEEIVEELCLDGETLFELIENDIDGLDIQDSEKESLKNFIKNKEKYIHLNVFIIICFKENFLKDKNISFYFMKENDKKFCCEYKILNQSNQIYKNEMFELFLTKIDLNGLTDKLYITLKNEKNEEYNGNIMINRHIAINNYFCFYNFNFGKSDLLENIFFNLPIDTIFNEFSRYFLKKYSYFKTESEKDMIKSLLEQKKIPLSGNNILKLIKYCVKYNLYYKDILEKLEFHSQIKSFI